MRSLAGFALIIPFQLFCGIVPDSLKTIDLQHKNLTRLPENFDYFNVQRLHLGYNPIHALPKELLNAEKLKNLTINNNTEFDIESSALIIKQLKIESLSINGSNMLYMPLEFGEIKSLKHLSVANNHIKEIPEYIFLHSDLYSLNVSENKILQLPVEIKSQANLKILDLSKNPCINQAQTYQRLNSLNMVELSVRGAGQLPSNIWSLKSVEKLDISEGKFTRIDLPDDIAKNNIKVFNASDCDLLDFATLLPFLSSSTLKEISIGGAKFFGFTNAAVSSGITRLALSGSSLDHFTLSNNLSELRELILNFDAIACQAELINTLSKTDNLKTLNLSNCNLTHLPPQISHLKHLETLNLSGNKFTSINSLLPLKQLLTLDVSLCELSKDEIEKLKKELSNTTIICNEAYEKLPLPNAVAKPELFTVSPAEPQTIITKNGTTISIPKNSLVFENGKAVKENVTVNYTPFYSLADIATSGINMNYNNAETNAPFSSAGMFKLTANVKGQNVELKKGAKIDIAFKSNDAEQSYNYYIYDTIKRTWKDIGKDTIAKIKEKKLTDTTLVNTLSVTNQTAKVPQPPMFYKNNPISIKWELKNHKIITGKFTIYTKYENEKIANDSSRNENFFNELKMLNNYSWVIDKEKGSSHATHLAKESKLFNHTSEQRRFNLKPRYLIDKTRTDKEIEFDLIPDKENDDFIMRFYDEVDTVSYRAYPILQNGNPDRAQKTIKKMYFAYNDKAKKRKEITKYRRAKFLASYKRFKVNMSDFRGTLTKNYEKSMTDLLNSKVNTDAFGVTRLLQLQGFGVYNCDRPVILDDPLVFSPYFYDDKGRKISSVAFQVIDPKENIVVSYYGPQKIKVSKNSIITFLHTEYNSKISSVFVGKLRTFDSAGKGGKLEVHLSQVPPSLSVGELNEYINSIN
ncbi:MAG: hypothetical protein H0U95_17795 [Bacteroidetes bacterium]|nr:hypothetical protein [Bacteroidota bacterium]